MASAGSVDPAAGGNMLGVVGQQRPSEREELRDALIGEAVIDGRVVAACVHESAPAQAGQVVGHLRLGLGEAIDELAHRQLAVVTEQLEDANACRVAERAEVLADELGLRRAFRKRKGRPRGGHIRHC
jgi:hypothetical protein